MPGWRYSWLFLALPTGLGGGSFSRKRVFSAGFVVLCVFVAVVELIAPNHFYVMRVK